MPNSRINHFPQPLVLLRWDYLILCKLDSVTAQILQRLEYWDFVKAEGNEIAESYNSAAERGGVHPTQDVSPWIYKTQDELNWELMKSCGEKKTATGLSTLVEIGYLNCRHNPEHPYDRTLQYQFNRSLVQKHVDQLGQIVETFMEQRPRRKPKMAWFAIERLTAEGVFLEHLTIDMVWEKVVDLATNSKVPKFLEKEAAFYTGVRTTSSRKNAAWETIVQISDEEGAKLHFEEEAELRVGECKKALAIPKTTTANTTTGITARDSFAPIANETPFLATSLEIPEAGENVSKSSQSRRSGAATGTSEAPRMASKVGGLTLQGQKVVHMYESIRGRKVPLSDYAVIAANALGEVEVTKENLRAVIEMLEKDEWFNRNSIGVDLHWVSRKYDTCLAAIERQRRLETLSMQEQTAQMKKEEEMSEVERRQRANFASKLGGL